MGEFLHERGFFDAPEFRRAEKRLDSWPASAWHKFEVTPSDCHERLFVRWRDPMVCLADTLHNPDLRPETDCVWGPEVLEDELTRAADPLRRGYLSEVFNAEWCAPAPRAGPQRSPTVCRTRA